MLTLTIRPVSAFCNSRCQYCYHEDDVLVPRTTMDSRVLELLVSKYQSGGRDFCRYVWHGGEPTIAGLDFYKKAAELQSFYRYSPDQEIKNSIQTNGWLLDSRWIDFLSSASFDIGLSLDGPEELNDAQRGRGCFQKTMKAVRLLQAADVPFFCICVVTSHTVSHPDVLFDFLVENDLRLVAFNPIFGEHPGFDLAPADFARFLTRIYDRWVDRDDPNLEIRFLKETVIAMMGGNIKLCMMQGGCQDHLVIEHDGRILPCHSYAGDSKTIGHLDFDDFHDIAAHTYFSPILTAVRASCSPCRWYSICGGDCIRFIDCRATPVRTSFCSARKEIFTHIERHLLATGFLTKEYHGAGPPDAHAQNGTSPPAD